MKNIAVLGLQISDYRDRQSRAMRRVMGELFDWYDQGSIAPLVSRVYPLRDFASAFAAIAARQAIGKLALAVR